MSVKIGRFAKVTLGVTTVAEISSYTLSGFTVDAIDVTAFGDEAKKAVPGMGDGGDISIKGNYDLSDHTGQLALDAACDAGTEYGPGEIRFYVDADHYLTPATGGMIIITKCRAIGMEKSGVGTVEFTGKVSGAHLEYI